MISEKIMKKLAIFFPGIGYHADKPLLYYSRKLAGEAGYEQIALKYDYQAGNIRGNKEKMEAALRWQDRFPSVPWKNGSGSPS